MPLWLKICILTGYASAFIALFLKGLIITQLKQKERNMNTKGEWTVKRMVEIDPGAFSYPRSIVEVSEEIANRRSNAFKQALAEADGKFNSLHTNFSPEYSNFGH